MTVDAALAGSWWVPFITGFFMGAGVMLLCLFVGWWLHELGEAQGRHPAGGSHVGRARPEPPSHVRMIDDRQAQA